MALLGVLVSPWAAAAAAVALVTYYLYPYFVTFGHLRDIPAPFPAQFSNLWLLSVCRRGNRYQTVDDVHAKLGPVVRIQPNHISIADDDAIQIIYGHGNGFLKAHVPSSKQTVTARQADIAAQLLLRRLRLHPTRTLQHA
jgi:benzoate 4-monooxygenase